MSTNTVTLHRVLRAPPERVYRAFLEPAAMAGIIRSAQGTRGTNKAYFDNTLAHLAACGIRDLALLRLARLVGDTGENAR